MPFDLSTLLDTAAAHAPILILIMALAALAEAALGLGPFVPGESIVVAGVLALDGSPLVLAAWPAVAAGAFLGDHVGYLIGRRIGPALGRSAVVRRIGVDRWDRATVLVRRHGMLTLVIARLLPGVRTLVAAAAGAAGFRYARFVLGDSIAATAWAGLWVFGGAAVGEAIGRGSWLVLLPMVAIALVAVVVWRTRAGHASDRVGTVRPEAAR